MQDIPADSVDMVLCDLPYGTTACSWDTVIPFAPLWVEYLRIGKRNAAYVFTASQPFTTALISSNLKMFKYEWIWEKPQGVNFLLAKKQPLKAHENIILFCAETATYNPKMKKGLPYITGKGDQAGVYGEVSRIQKENEGRYPKTTLKFNTEVGDHPTQKPVKLFQYLIETYTDPGEIVLDNCIGSGTTAIAAIKSNRRYVGIELNQKYVDIARKRIENELKQGNLFRADYGQ